MSTHRDTGGRQRVTTTGTVVTDVPVAGGTPPAYDIVEIEPSMSLVEQVAVSYRPTAMPTDSSLAIKYSILRNHDLVASQIERPRLINRVLWPVAMAIAVWAWFLTMWYRLWWLLRKGFAWAVRNPALALPRVRWAFGPERLSFFFDRAHWLAARLRSGVTSSAALDAVYAAPNVLPEKPKGIRERIASLWFNYPEAIAVRNRLRITYLSICARLERRARKGQHHVRFLTLACGSAEASIEAIAWARKQFPTMQVRLTLVDLNESSLHEARGLAEALGVDDCLDIRVANLRDFLQDRRGNEAWDDIEMVGFLDYRFTKSFVETCQGARWVMAPDGQLIISCILPGNWKFVLRWVQGWAFLRRRSPKEIDVLLKAAGFPVRIPKPEPQNGHLVVECRELLD